MIAIAARYGLILAAVGVVYNIVLYRTGLFKIEALGYVGLVFAIVALYAAFTAYKKGNNGCMSFGSGFGGGSLIILISAIATSVFGYIYMSFVDPTIIDQLLAMTREKMLENPEMTRSEVDSMIKLTSSILSPTSIAASGIVSGFLGGAVLALVMAAFNRKGPAKS